MLGRRISLFESLRWEGAQGVRWEGAQVQGVLGRGISLFESLRWEGAQVPGCAGPGDIFI